MIKHTNHTIINDDTGNPQFVVVPYSDYVKHFDHKSDKAIIPHAVIQLQVANDCTLMEAWRRHLKMSQQELADKLGTSQPNYAKIEKSNNPRRDTIARIASAMGIETAQLSE